MVLHESVRNITAMSLGYHSRSYSYYFAQLFFQNEEMLSSSDSILNSYKRGLNLEKNGYRDTDQWKEFVNQDRKDHAIIALSGKIFTLLITLIGLIILFIRREKRRLKFEIIDWLGVFMALFIMKDSLVSLVYGVGAEMSCSYIACDYAAFARYFNLSVYGTEWVIFLLGVLISSYVIFGILQRKIIMPFIISGFLGGITGIILWSIYLGPALAKCL